MYMYVLIKELRPFIRDYVLLYIVYPLFTAHIFFIIVSLGFLTNLTQLTRLFQYMLFDF